MTTLSTHVLDSGLGCPAAGLALGLTGPDEALLAKAATHADGRVRFDLAPAPGDPTVLFETGTWFDAAGRDHLHPSVTVSFTVTDQPHLHVALLLGPWSYTTYRGS